jgi:hypothetical protein
VVSTQKAARPWAIRPPPSSRAMSAANTTNALPNTAGKKRVAVSESPSRVRDGWPRFALFLYEGPDYHQPTPGGMDQRVEEYVAWASAKRTDGAVEGGEKLKDGDDMAIEPDGSAGAVPSPPGGARLAGYFLIRAADQRTALEIARSCPHVRYGGRIVLREIEPT